MIESARATAIFTSEPDRETVASWLRETDAAALERLWQAADRVRHDTVGDAVHLRGLIEMSNHCRRQCAYCGLHAAHGAIQRYRMTDTEVMECARTAVEYGYGTVVIQTGEDYGLTSDRMAALIRRIKAETPLAVTLSLGERDDAELAEWKSAGADRYLLRFETSDPALYAFIHPDIPGRKSDRFAILRTLRRLGYEIGSGVMIGIPGQTYDSLANDILKFRELDLDMIGTGPFILHPASDLAQHALDGGAEQVPATEAMVYKALALARLLCPEANIPSTTALATLNKASGRETGLCRGANVVMPNLTPVQYRALYEIYPAKVCINETAEDCRGCLLARLRSIGRHVGQGPGSRFKTKSGDGAS
jgi:biotin synthase